MTSRVLWKRWIRGHSIITPSLGPHGLPGLGLAKNSGNTYAHLCRRPFKSTEKNYAPNIDLKRFFTKNTSHDKNTLIGDVITFKSTGCWNIFCSKHFYHRGEKCPVAAIKNPQSINVGSYYFVFAVINGIPDKPVLERVSLWFFCCYLKICISKHEPLL